MTDIIGIILSAITLVVTIAAIIVGAVVAYKIAKRQEKLENTLTREQQILSVTQDLHSHLIKWHDALRREMRKHNRQSLKNFKNNQEYQGKLSIILTDLRRFQECTQIVQKAENFESTAIFIKGHVLQLDDLTVVYRAATDEIERVRAAM
jgi:biopolymer transport protein ExbB/TolQ